MMDATYTAVLRLWEQEHSIKDISRRLNISHGKVLKILVTAGAVETAESKMYSQGKSTAEISEALNKSEKAVSCRIPYEKGMYGAEYPTINALRIRKCREKGAKV
nr:MAG TPA: Protein of unknown function (DUF1670) [Caudoviricetes sp.]